MAKTRDPYYEWLGIPPKDQPPNHYRLLGLEVCEENRDVIAAAADRQMSFVKSYQCGEGSELSQKILNELSAARLCLLNPQKKAAYDEELRFSTECEFAPDDVESEEASAQAAWLGYEEPKPPALPVAPTPASNPFQSRVFVIMAASALACLLAGVAAGIVALKMKGNGDPQGDAVAQDLQETPTNEVMDTPSAEETLQQGEQERSAVAEQTSLGEEVTPQPNMNAGTEMDVAESAPQNSVAPADIPPEANQIESTPSPAPPSVEPIPSPVPPSEIQPVPSVPQPAQEPVPGIPAPVETETDPPDVPSRLPVPDSESQQQMRAEIAEVFNLDADTPNEKRKLCGELLDLANDPNESPDRRFVLLRLVAELASSTSDAADMLQAVDQIGASYDIQATEAKATMLEQMLGDGKTSTTALAYMKAYQSVVNEAAQDDNFELACRLSSAANILSDRPYGGKDFRQGIKDHHAEIERLRDQYRLVEKAFEVLDKDEHNAEACLTAGRWLCLVKDDWDRGLAYLARSSDERLRAVALLEMDPPSGHAAALTALADAWWEIAKDATPETRYGLLSRAQHWCSQIDVDSLTGLNRVKIERRLAEIDDLMGELDSRGIRVAGTSDDGQIGDAKPATSSEVLSSLFSRGLTAALEKRDFDLAERLFRRCTELDANNAAAVNNYALASLRTGNKQRVVHLLQTAHELAPESQQIVHNISKLSRLAGAGQISFDRSAQDDIESLVASAGAAPSISSSTGFLYMPLDASSSTSGQYVDQACPQCNGRGYVECPVRACSRGSVASTRTDVAVTPTGQRFAKTRPTRVPCRNCRGRGQVPCPRCKGQGVGQY